MISRLRTKAKALTGCVRFGYDVDDPPLLTHDLDGLVGAVVRVGTMLVFKVDPQKARLL